MRELEDWRLSAPCKVARAPLPLTFPVCLRCPAHPLHPPVQLALHNIIMANSTRKCARIRQLRDITDTEKGRVVVARVRAKSGHVCRMLAG